jgi:hypothetical protein
MSFFKNPSELEVKKTISILIYGQPGLWKTTTGLSAPNPALFDYDGGVHRIHAAHRVRTFQPKCWDETNQLLASDEVAQYDTIVIDTAGKMLDFMNADIIARSKDKRPNRSLALKEYGERKQLFIAFVKAVTMMGKNVVFIAHEREERDGDTKIVRPEIGGSSAGDLIKELDLVGYMEAHGSDRTISFHPCERFYAKNTCNLPPLIRLPAVVDGEGNITGANNFLTTVIEKHKAYQEKQASLARDYELLMDVIRENVAAVADVESANSAVEQIEKLGHIFDSKIKAGVMLNEAASALGLKYSKANKRYEAGKV